MDKVISQLIFFSVVKRENHFSNVSVLAVTFSNRSLVLASVQDGHQLLSETLPNEIRSCHWLERILGPQDEDLEIPYESVPTDDYLPPLVDLPSVNRARKHIVDPPDDLFSLDKQNKLNMSVIKKQLVNIDFHVLV